MMNNIEIQNDDENETNKNLDNKKPRIQYNDDVKNLFSIFQIDDKNLIDIKGSYSNKNIYNYGDYDFFTKNYTANYTNLEIFEDYRHLLRNIIENINCYFIELKIQQLDGTNKKWLPNQLFKFNQFDNIFNSETEFIKIDIVYFSPKTNNFIEASCNYNFHKKNQSDNEAKKEINQNIEKLKKEKDYFKILKRLYLLSMINNDNNKYELLTNFFNSEIGSYYKEITNIEAIELIKKYYGNDALTKKRIETNLTNINYPLNYSKLYNERKKILNDKALKIYKEIK